MIIVSPPRIVALAYITTLSHIVGCLFIPFNKDPSFNDLAPRVTPWYIDTLFPIIQVSPITIPVPWSIKKFSPILHEGWISIPVTECAYSESILGINGTFSVSNKWAILYTYTAWKLLTKSTTSSIDLHAGSCNLKLSMSFNNNFLISIKLSKKLFTIFNLLSKPKKASI